MLTQNPGGSILVVSHNGLINLLLGEITGQKFRYFSIDPAAITEIEVDGKGKILSDKGRAFGSKTVEITL